LLTLDQPGSRANTLASVLGDLEAAVKQVQARTAVGAYPPQRQARMFIAGAGSQRNSRRQPDPGIDPQAGAAWSQPLAAFDPYRARRCAIDGACMGGGLELCARLRLSHRQQASEDGTWAAGSEDWPHPGWADATVAHSSVRPSPRNGALPATPQRREGRERVRLRCGAGRQFVEEAKRYSMGEHFGDWKEDVPRKADARWSERGADIVHVRCPRASMFAKTAANFPPLAAIGRHSPRAAT